MKSTNHSIDKGTHVEAFEDDPLMSESLRHVDDESFNYYNRVPPHRYVHGGSNHEDDDIKMISHIQQSEPTSGVETIDEKWQNSTSLLKERQTSTPEHLSWYIPSSMTKDDGRTIFLALTNERNTAITPNHPSS